MKYQIFSEDGRVLASFDETDKPRTLTIIADEPEESITASFKVQFLGGDFIIHALPERPCLEVIYRDETRPERTISLLNEKPIQNS